MSKKITKHGEHADKVPQSHTAYAQDNTTTSTCQQADTSVIGNTMTRQETSGPVICVNLFHSAHGQWPLSSCSYTAEP